MPEASVVAVVALVILSVSERLCRCGIRERSCTLIGTDALASHTGSRGARGEGLPDGPWKLAAAESRVLDLRGGMG